MTFGNWWWRRLLLVATSVVVITPGLSSSMVEREEGEGSSCPWEEDGLLLWSDSQTWGEEGVPTENSKVTIPSGHRVLLDTQPDFLASLVIEEGGALIWGDEEGLVLNTNHVFVKGEFHIGSESCRFQKNARIRLHGLVNDEHKVMDYEFGRKFIGVAPGATLELHGKLKTPWTKLARTVHPSKDVDCYAIYDHNIFDAKNNKVGMANHPGLNVLVWNQDGSFMDYANFRDYDEFPNFFESIPEGKVVAMHAYGNKGIGKKTNSMVDTIVSLGGSKINEVPNNSPYYFIGRIGSSDSVVEDVGSSSESEKAFLQLDEKENDMVFQVAANFETVKASAMFQIVHFDIAYPKLTLVDQVQGWEEGDEVLLLSTDYFWEQAEIRRVISCDDCTPHQIRINAPLTYTHFGNFTFHVDERGEVALLSRCIVVEGVMEDTCEERTQKEKDLEMCNKFDKDMFGGHLKVMRGFQAAHIRAVKFLHMGQQINLGAYAIHFHMCDDVTNAYVRENVVVEARSRCITVHGTNKLEVSDNVCYKHHGHGLFLEDAVEQENIISGNLVAGTMHGTLILTDMDKEWCNSSLSDFCQHLGSYWLTHPNNIVKNNVAAGGIGIGFIYVFADLPLGPSRERQEELNRPHHPKDMPLFFSGNVAHSNRESGMHMDEKISTNTGVEGKAMAPQNGILKGDNQYDPHVDGKPVWVDMANSTFYKNGKKNIWLKAGNVRMNHCAFADSKQSLTGGTTMTESGVELYKCLFIGETENVGLPLTRTVHGVSGFVADRAYFGMPDEPYTATSIYQGPIFMNGCYFDQYVTKRFCLDQTKTVGKDCKEKDVLTRHAGAISFKRGNTYPSMTSTYAVNNAFGYCDNAEEGLHWVYHGLPDLEYWTWKDGNNGVFIRDKDGQLTGTANASIVGLFPFLSGDECQERAGWNLQVCPYRYIKMEIKGRGGNLSPSNKNQHPTTMHRDDIPYDVPYSLKGEIRNEYLLRTHRSYILDFNDDLDGAAFPEEFRIFGYGVEIGDVVRMGICQAMDVTGFDVLMDYPVPLKNNATWVGNLTALDADTTGAAFFHDIERGILFFKMVSFHVDTNETQRCPDGHCFYLKVKPKGGTLSNLRKCVKLDIQAYDDSTPTPATPETPECSGGAELEDQGPVDWSNPGFIEHEKFTVPCTEVKAPQRKAPEEKGCFNEKYKKTDQDLRFNEQLFYEDTMTVDICVDRCYFRNYQYAGLSRGARCTCSNTLLDSAEYQAKSSKCNNTCRGTSQMCGGSKEISVWTTGR